MKFILTALLLFSANSFASCPDVNGNTAPDVWVKSNTYWIFYYVTKITSTDIPQRFVGTTVVTTKHGEEIFREENVQAEDNHYADYLVQGYEAGFSFDSFTQENAEAWITINGKDQTLSSVEVKVAKFTPIACP